MKPTAQAARPFDESSSTRMPTRWGVFQTLAFEREIANGTRRVETALALVLGDLTEGAPLVRIHSQCFTGEVLGSLRCDCNDQLDIAMRAIAEEGRGLLIYEHQEGRGIGLMASSRPTPPGRRPRHGRCQPCLGLQGGLPGFQLARRDLARASRQPGSPAVE